MVHKTLTEQKQDYRGNKGQMMCKAIALAR